MADLFLFKKRMEHLLEKVKGEIATAPEGHLVKSGSLYHVVNNVKVGISRNKEMIRKLYRKRFLLEVEEILQFNLALSLNHLNEFKRLCPLKIIKGLPLAYKEFPPEYFFYSRAETILAGIYEVNPYEAAVEYEFVAPSGEILKSKSESLIYEILDSLPVHFWVEIAFVINNRKVFPDFTVYDPYFDLFFIIEHFGMAGSSSYDKSMIDKIVQYEKHGWKVNEKFIYTLESDVRDLRQLRKKIVNFIYNGLYEG